MGEHEGRAQPPSGLLANGLLPNEEASVTTSVLDSERWLKAEERTAELIACIQPNQSSEDRRKAVADYVQGLITKCFPCEVFTFGSVPLKTYLPDGDIDLTAFSKNQNLKDTWAHQVRDMLENEEKNENAEFRVKEVQYIQAEVKIIKCLVENIVVDISFNQLGGLCTLCFLEEVDQLINQNYLFKRSIILIKAWCYYESRILGAHHGLISTYALETLVLYIFHVFNKKFAGPLEVLYCFLEFFSKFDWDNFSLSLWGPVPVSSLPDVAAQPPRKDAGDVLLSKLFLDACSTVYAVFPGGQENQGQTFVSKHFNVIDPLRITNNLGRSVSKGNFFRIRSAFAFGAKRLARLLDCPKEDILFEVNQFFMNTWDRHSYGHRPDVPNNDLLRFRISDPDYVSLHPTDNSSSKKSENSSSRDIQVERTQGARGVSSQHGNNILESTYRNSDVPPVSRAQSQKTYSNLKNSRDKSRQEISSNQVTEIVKGQIKSKPDSLLNDTRGRFVFARTHSSPELADAYNEACSQGRCNRAPETGKTRTTTKLDGSWRKNAEPDAFANHSRSSADDSSSVRHISSRERVDTATGSNSPLNSYQDDAGLGVTDKEYSSTVGTQRMHQEAQDPVNMMASPSANYFNGQMQVPLNLASGHLPLSIPPSVLASLYTQRNMAGMVPTNFPLLETPWSTNMQFHQGLMSSPLNHYLPDIGLTSNTEESTEPGNELSGSTEMGLGEIDNDFWHEQGRGSRDGFDLDNESFEMIYSDDKQQATSAGYNYVSSSPEGSSSSTTRVQQKFPKENRGSTREDHIDTFQYEENSGNELRYLPATHGTSLRSKTSSESSWEGSSAKSSRSTREKRGRKTASSALPSDMYGQGKSLSEHSCVQIEPENREWNSPSIMGTEMVEKITGSQAVASLHVPGHQISSLEPSQMIASDSVMPMGPMHIGSDSGQRAVDNPGVFPFTFYPTGPPVPFVTMLPLYNFSNETGTSDAATSILSGEEGQGNTVASRNSDSLDGLHQSEMINTNISMRRAASAEPSGRKPEILSSDFASHWHNLQYGRLCQNSRYPSPLIYPSPVVVPPVYLQGCFPWEGPGRPLSANMNLFTQLSYGPPRLLPVTPPVSSRPGSVYQHYVDEMPRYRSGTGTYLPNPKVSARDRQSSSTRRASYSSDRSDHHGEREGNRSINSKPRATGRSLGHSQAEKPNSRPERLAASESRVERSRSSYRHDSYPSFQSQNDSVRSSTQSTSANVAYGMYPLPTMNHSGVSSNGPSVPSIVMLYPYDHSTGYGSHNEQLERGSLGPVGFSGASEASQLSEGSQSSGVFEEQRFHSSAAQQSSPNQPSSPHPWRERSNGVAVRPSLIYYCMEMMATKKEYAHKMVVECLEGV